MARIEEVNCANGSNIVRNKIVTNSGKAAPRRGSKQNQNGIRYGVLARWMEGHDEHFVFDSGEKWADQ